jgi:hypothetical protein
VIQLALTYLLLLIALIALSLFRSPNVLAGITVIVEVATVGGRGHSSYERFTDDLKSMLYGSGSGHVNHDQYVLAILCVMFALVAVCYFDDLDGLPESKVGEDL